MGTISSAAAFYGLSATGTPTKTQSAGATLLGVGSTSMLFPSATKAYCVSATLATAADTLTIDTATGIATIGTAPVSQVETATVVAASGATSSGNLAVTVTAAGVTGSPLAFSVALVNGVDTTATLIAAKIRTALNTSTALVAVYTVGGTGADVTLTRITAANNDATLNIAITAGLGVSAIASSTNTTAGVGGVVLTNNTGDGKDFEGISLGTISQHFAILIRNTSHPSAITWDLESGTQLGSLNSGNSGVLLFSNEDSFTPADLVITSASEFEASVEITIIS